MPNILRLNGRISRRIQQQRFFMRLPKWTIVIKTTPIDPRDAQEEARWLKLGDDALANRKDLTEQKDSHLLAPGSRAKTQLKRMARELEQTARKYLKLTSRDN